MLESENVNTKDITVKKNSDLLAFDIIGKIGFGYDFDSQLKNQSKFVELLLQHFTGARQQLFRVVMTLCPSVMKIPFGPGKHLRTSNEQAKKDMNEVGKSFLMSIDVAERAC